MDNELKAKEIAIEKIYNEIKKILESDVGRFYESKVDFTENYDYPPRKHRISTLSTNKDLYTNVANILKVLNGEHFYYSWELAITWMIILTPKYSKIHKPKKLQVAEYKNDFNVLKESDINESFEIVELKKYAAKITIWRDELYLVEKIKRLINQ